MAFTFDAVSSGGYDAGSSNTSHVIANHPNRVLAVAVVTESGVPSGVTFNGDAMTLGRNYTAGDFDVSVWYLLQPDITTANIAVTFASGTPDHGVMAQSWYADGAITFDKTADVSDDSSAISGSLTTAVANELLLGFWGDDDDNASARTATTGTTERHDRLGGSGAGDFGMFSGSKIAVTAGVNTMGYSDGDIGSADGVMIAFIETADALTVTTEAATDVTNESATLNGTVTEDGGDTVTRRGFVVDTSTHTDPGDTDPDVSDYPTVIDESGTFGEEAFDLPASSLDETTIYYVRAFAETTEGFEYGSEVTFETDFDPIFELVASANITASGEATTAQLTAPAGKTTSDFVAGRIQDDENPSDTVNITSDDYTELEWCIQATAYAIDAETYEFRVTANGVVLDTYTVTPQWLIGAGGAAPRRIFMIS